MSNEFKKLTEVEVLEELSKNAHVIVEDNGVTGRYPAGTIGSTGITNVLMHGDKNGLVIDDTVYSVGYSYDGSGSVSAADEEYGVSPAISLSTNTHAIRTSFVHCGENLTAIKYALFNRPCFVRANNIPCRNVDTDEDRIVNFGGMCHWATTPANLPSQAGICDALFFGGVIVYLVE